MTVQQISPENNTVPVEALQLFSDAKFPLRPFDDLTIDFFNTLSKQILSDKEINRVPAIAALGFWLRKANFRNIYKQNRHLFESADYRISPLGIVFHVCPSNVDTMFLYSLSISLAAGNKNIVRISERLNHPHISYIITLLNKTIAQKEYLLFQNYICILKYGHDDDINRYFSERADARILWGGDATIHYFKNIPVQPRIKDIAFADRISISLIKSDEFNRMAEAEKKELVRKFFNDSYTFDQKGCSSPQVIFIYGNSGDNAIFEKEFYSLLNAFSSLNYDNDISSLSSLKFNQMADDAIDGTVSGFINQTNDTVFADSENLKNLKHSCGGGYFYTKQITQLNELIPFINKKTQTLSYFGLGKNEINEIITSAAGIGIDRIVPIGKALEFNYIWDGFNLLDELSGKIYFQ